MKVKVLKYLISILATLIILFSPVILDKKVQRNGKAMMPPAPGVSTLYSITDGDWSDGSTWSYSQDGVACGCTPDRNDNIYVEDSLTLDMNVEIGNVTGGGNLYVTSGSITGPYTLTIGNNGSAIVGTIDVDQIVIQNHATLTINFGYGVTANDIIFRNNSEVTINGWLFGETLTSSNNSMTTGTGCIDLNNGDDDDALDINNNSSIFGFTDEDDICDDDSDDGNCQFGNGCGVALPIELVYFKANSSDNSVELIWQTATEINNDYFIIERSENGVDFVELFRVDGSGNSNKKIDYEYYDNNPIKGTSYYRLKQVDYDGKYSYSEIVASVNNDNFVFEIFPMPLSKYDLRINFSKQITGVVSIYDIYGKVVYQKRIIEQNILIVEKDLSAGKYHFIIRNNNNKIYTRQIIIN